MQIRPLNNDYLEVTDAELQGLSPSGIFQMAASMGGRGRRARSVESRLALAVQELASLEEGTEASLRAAVKILDDGKRRRLHEESGFDSWNELRRRLLGSRSLLEALLGIDDLGDVPSPPISGILPTRGEDPKKRRTQRARALVRLSGAILKLRNIEEDLTRRTAASRAVMEHIESSRLHEECGYTSFEEFLSCVLAPCPTLAIAMATADAAGGDTRATGPANDVECAVERSVRARSTPPPLPILEPAPILNPVAPHVVAAAPQSTSSTPAHSLAPSTAFDWPRVPLPLVFVAGIAIALLLAWPPELTAAFGP